MLGIYADVFMTATRNNRVELHEMPRDTKERRRWFRRGRKLLVDLHKL